jgi:hypothetical protein
MTFIPAKGTGMSCEDGPKRGFIVILKPHELETTTNLNDVLMEPKFANTGGKILNHHKELYCDERPPIHEGQVFKRSALSIRTENKPR